MTAAAKFFLHALASLPIPLLSGIGFVLAWLFHRFDRKGKTYLFQNISAIYRLPAHSYFARLFARQVYRHQVAANLEAIKEILRPGSIRIDGYEAFAQAYRDLLAQGPLTICAAHFGSWEIAGACCGRAQAGAFYPLAKPAKSKLGTTLLDWLRGRSVAGTLWTDDRQLVRKILTSYQKGAVGFVADQKPLARQGIDVVWFGLRTPMVSGPATFTLRVDAAMLCIYAARKGPGWYEIHYEVIRRRGERIETADAAPGSKGLEQGLSQRLADSMERFIRLYPEQWVWNYKRWKF